MLVLFETSAGFAIFKLLDEKKLKQSENLYKDFETVDSAKKVVKLKSFDKFEDTTEALASATAAIEGKMSKGLKKVLKKIVAKDAQEKLAVADAKLGNAIQNKLNLQCVFDSKVSELMRCIRSQLSGLVSGLPEKEMAAMSLGLAHSLSRYKLKFSPDKIDTMIVQAVSLLDDLDKELNNYIMRCREWYGWHFPELGKVITDNLAYVKTVKKMGLRANAANIDLSDILPEDVEEKVKEMAEISMGTEISDLDMLNVSHLCEQVIEIQEYRAQLYEYLKNRMVAIAPNLTILVGELVGARLISHAGSLLNLAKHPSSTVQILGSEKALFKALKTNHDTPKYGLIYHAQLIGSTSTKLKGKASRMLAAKAALGTRVDALGEDVTSELGVEHRAKVEARIRALEGGHSYQLSGTGKKSAKFDKYENKSEVVQYKDAADSSMPSSSKRKFSDEDQEETVAVKVEEDGETPVKKKKKKNKNKESNTAEVVEAPPAKKKKVSEASAAPEETSKSTDSEKKKKKRASENNTATPEEDTGMNESEAKKKKKRKAKTVSNGTNSE